MDFMQRANGGQPAPANNSQARPAAPNHEGGPANFNKPPGKFHSKSKPVKILTVTSVILLFSVVVLLIAMLVSLAIGGKKASDSRYLDKTKLQAVFVVNQQLPYFARIAEMNSKYMVLQDIYYLSVNQQVQPNTSNQQQSADVKLVKLGCELHGPQDRMVLNRDQVVLWENLKDDGQVAEAVKKYKEQYPNGQECQKPTAQTEEQSNTEPTTTAPTENTNRR